jgi:hypothetical protein
VLGATLPAVAQPVVRDHRGDRDDDNDRDAPRAAPPAPRVERREVRRGFTWIAGRWDWRDGRWSWRDGHWERERSGKRWRDHRWERRDDRWVMIEGDWVDIDARPSGPPPPPREERWDARPGFVWVRGRWDWRDGSWAWREGSFERERERERWTDGRWELRDDRWEWTEGGWRPLPPPPPRDEPVILVSAASAKCLDAGGGPKGDGTPLQLWRCNGTEAQAFAFRLLDGGRFNLVHAGSGTCVDVAARGDRNDTQLRLARCTGAASQAFTRTRAGNEFQLVSADGARCFEVEGGRSDNGTRILHRSCHGGPNQLWHPPGPISEAPPPPRPRDEPVVLVSAASGKCLDAGGGPKRLGTPLQLWECNGTEAQDFEFRVTGERQINVLHARSGMCLDVASPGTSRNDRQLRLAPCTGAASQVFARVAAGNAFQLISAANGHCLDVEGSRSDNGTRILDWGCHGRPDQLWRLPGAAPQPAPVRDVEAGPIWNQPDAESKCPQVCRPPAHWNGQWHTTDPGRMSVCSCVF